MWLTAQPSIEFQALRFLSISQQDIFALKSLLPSVNQVEYHPYWHEDDLVGYCLARNITFNGYSPLGARDISPARSVVNESFTAQHK